MDISYRPGNCSATSHANGMELRSVISATIGVELRWSGGALVRQVLSYDEAKDLMLKLHSALALPPKDLGSMQDDSAVDRLPPPEIPAAVQVLIDEMKHALEQLAQAVLLEENRRGDDVNLLHSKLDALRAEVDRLDTRTTALEDTATR